MARQYQLPGVGYINADEDGREYQIPGGGYFNDETAGGGGSTTFTPSGGLVFGDLGPFTVSKILETSSGVVLDGTAQTVVGKVLETSGEVVFSGIGGWLTDLIFVPSGGVVFGGEVPLLFNVTNATTRPQRRGLVDPVSRATRLWMVKEMLWPNNC